MVVYLPHSMMLEMLEIFWNGYHLLLQPLTDDVNNLWIDTAGNPSEIDISRALLMLRNWRLLWLRKKDSWLMVGNVVTIGREMMVGVTWDVEIEEGEYV